VRSRPVTCVHSTASTEDPEIGEICSRPIRGISSDRQQEPWPTETILLHVLVCHPHRDSLQKPQRRPNQLAHLARALIQNLYLPSAAQADPSFPSIAGLYSFVSDCVASLLSTTGPFFLPLDLFTLKRFILLPAHNRLARSSDCSFLSVYITDHSPKNTP